MTITSCGYGASTCKPVCMPARDFPRQRRQRRVSLAKDFDLHSNEKAKSNQRPSRRDAIPFDSGRKRRHDVRPIDSDKAESGVSWPGFWPRSLTGAAPIILLGIAILCTLDPSLKDKKSTAARPESHEQLRSGPTSPPSSPQLPLSKPSPIPPAVTARPEGSQTAKAVSNLPGSSAPHYHPVRYEATHKKALGGCTGQLELTSGGLHFKCANQADLNIPVGSIARAHKDGVVLESGEKYHFLIANHTKDQVEAIFILWLDGVHQSQQPNRE